MLILMGNYIKYDTQNDVKDFTLSGKIKTFARLSFQDLIVPCQTLRSLYATVEARHRVECTPGN